MINIQSFVSLKHDKPVEVLDASANEVYDALNPITKKKVYSEYSLIRKAERFRDELISEKNEAKDKKFHARKVALLNYFCSENILKKFVTSRPEKFNNLIDSVYKYIRKEDLYTIKGKSFFKTPFGEELYKKVFNYDNYRSNPIIADIYTKLGFDSATCPYCNAAHVTIVESKKRKINLYELDHFYPKAKYPFLALSFFNHIPSCSDCNGKLKRSRDFRKETHIHPYDRCFDEVYTFEPNKEVLNGELLQNVMLIKSDNSNDELKTDLLIEARYNKIINACKLQELINLIYDSYDLYEQKIECRAQKQYINGIKSHIELNKNEILGTIHSKLKRDIVKAFDLEKKIVID